jgi:predicted acetylornithine/succinylornithine family transaminase
MNAPDAGDTSSLLAVYRRPDPVFERGEGCELIDTEGRRYLDFTAGIGVSALGHGSPVIREAARAALDKGIIHTSNLYRTAPGEALADLLCRETGMDRVFFCNSGGEGIEGALKFARKRARVEAGWTLEGGDAPGFRKTGVVAFHGAFHGRLFGSLAATHKAQYRAPFEPVMPGVTFVDREDRSAVDAALDPDTVAAVLVEPIQGEGGIRPLPDDFLRDLRTWTRERGITLILDEIQCGVGRTGTFRAHEQAGIRPDILVLAKPLAGGLPMGAILVTDDVASALQPGDHGTTFGGGPFVAAVALAVVGHIARPAFLAHVRERGETLARLLEGVAERHPGLVSELRGRGLMRGLELTFDVAPVVAAALRRGLLLVGAGPRTIRFLPPLVVTDAELERGIAIVEEAMLEAAGEAGMAGVGAAGSAGGGSGPAPGSRA